MVNNNLIVRYDRASGGVTELSVKSDENALNFIESKCGLGVPYGKHTLISTLETNNGWVSTFAYKKLKYIVQFTLDDDNLTMRCTFTNDSRATREFAVHELGFYAPFNDNYAAAKTCLKSKCHAHVWTADSTAYIRAQRMDGGGGNIAMLMTEGRAGGYGVEREWNSNDRGDIVILLGKATIPPGGAYAMEFVFFKHGDNNDFIRLASEYNQFLPVMADRYSAAIGQTVTVKIGTRAPIVCSVGDTQYPPEKREDGYVLKLPIEREGDFKLDIKYGSRHTFIQFHAHCGIAETIDKRLDFITERQQVYESGETNGAFSLYDNETGAQYVENKVMCDRNYGRERLGMAAALIRRIKSGNLTESRSIKYSEAARKAMEFYDARLVKDNGAVYDKPTYKKMLFHDRLYNYAWAMELYTSCYELFGEERHLDKAINVACKYYKNGGADFYAINIPMNRLYRTAIRAGKDKQADILKNYFLSHGNKVLLNGVDYPAHEVKYEQSIVAPAIDILLECYALSNDKKYLTEAEKQMPLLIAFNGNQPDFHLNGIAIRHWDGYWFGKNKMYGDTFPHYWSCISAAVFSKYAAITGKSEFQAAADNILNNNLSLIQGGKGSCAYIYPDVINGKSGKFYDPWANDQDWLIWFNLNYNSALKN